MSKFWQNDHSWTIWRKHNFCKTWHPLVLLRFIRQNYPQSVGLVLIDKLQGRAGRSHIWPPELEWFPGGSAAVRSSLVSGRSVPRSGLSLRSGFGHSHWATGPDPVTYIGRPGYRSEATTDYHRPVLVKLGSKQRYDHRQSSIRSQRVNTTRQRALTNVSWVKWPRYSANLLTQQTTTTPSTT